MKTSKLSKIMGIGVTIALLTSLLTMAVPVSAALSASTANALIWNGELGPSSSSTGSQTLQAGSDINSLAVASDGATVYAVDTPDKRVYKSTNGGTTWTRLIVTANATQAPALVAVAPGDATYLVVTTTTNQAYLSNDGGLTFSQIAGTLSDTTTTGANMTISAIAISAQVAGVRNIALAGTNGAGAADIQYLNQGALVTSWTSMTTGTGWVAAATNIQGTATAVRAIAFSPNYASDRMLVAVTNNAANTTLEVASFSTLKWDNLAGFTSYPKFLLIGQATVANIALPSTYLGVDETLRTAFVALTTGVATGALLTVKDSGTSLTTVQGSLDFTSVDYNGTTLVAGATDSTNVYASANPTATIPTVTNTSLYQRPSGVGSVKVKWVGANVAAGTTGANSAYAVSKDNGATFNDVSLVDTAISNYRDFAVDAGATVLYTLSDDNATGASRR
jgi:hypothetical protein